MPAVSYAIVFNGEIVEGFQVISVKAHLAKMLKADAEKMKILFSGKPIVLKRTADKTEAARYGAALKKVGANVRVKILKADKATAGPTGAKAGSATPGSAGTSGGAEAAARVPDTSNLSVLPNEGNLVEAKPAAAAPDLDLSEYAVLENDGSPLVEEIPFERADIDVSAISVAENDGSPLEEPHPDAPRVEAPDFGLDEPGAVLETIKEEVEELHPDTSGLSLAFPGSDLLNPDEKDDAPPPKAPDTSKLSVVAVFDN